jgi:hypothetical protein
MTASSALLVLLAASAPPPAPFEGCTATPLAQGWQYDCAGARLRIEDHDAPPSAAYVDGLAAASRVAAGKGGVEKRGRRTIGGTTADVREFAAPGSGRHAVLASLPHRSGTRLLFCVAEAPARCGGRLDALAASGWRGGALPGSARQEAPRLALAEREVRVPAGCEGVAQPYGGRVSCAGPFFAAWNVIDPARASDVMAEFGRNVERNLAAAGARRDEVDCRLDGVPTRCARLTVKGEKVHAVVLWAAAAVRSQTIFASCMASGVDAAASPCSVLFRVP